MFNLCVGFSCYLVVSKQRPSVILASVKNHNFIFLLVSKVCVNSSSSKPFSFNPQCLFGHFVRLTARRSRRVFLQSTKIFTLAFMNVLRLFSFSPVQRRACEERLRLEVENTKGHHFHESISGRHSTHRIHEAFSIFLPTFWRLLLP